MTILTLKTAMKIIMILIYFVSLKQAFRELKDVLNFAVDLERKRIAL